MTPIKSHTGAPSLTGRVLVVDDEWIVAKHLERILVDAGHEVVATITDPALAARALAEKRPDLALFDIRLGSDADGVEIASSEARRFGIGVVYVSAHADVSTLERAGHELCVGFLVKPFSEPQVRATVQLALERVRRHRERARGEAAHGSPAAALDRLASAIAELDIRSSRRSRTSPAPRVERSLLERLSAREWEVLRGLVAHRRVGSIAKTLHISQHTVRNHLKSIYVKLDVTSQEELLERVLRPHAVDPGRRDH